MAWDAAAQKVAIKAIGTVEASMQYDVINYNDPITVGIGQWYGPRAAAILMRMKTEGWWQGCAASLENDLAAHPANSWWTGRYLSTTEGNSIKPILLNNKAIQGDQIIKDLDDYINVWVSKGGSTDNTDSMIMFFVAYHQGPAYALAAMNTCGYSANLAQVRNAMLSNGVLGQYPNRYNTAYTIIASHDSSGVVDTGSTPVDNPGQVAPVVETRRLVDIWQHGDLLMMAFSDGKQLVCSPAINNHWVPPKDVKIVEGKLPDAVNPPTNPGPSSTKIGEKIAAFVDEFKGKAVDVDGFAGSQCVDLARKWCQYLYGDIQLITPGTSAYGAKDIWPVIWSQRWTKIQNIWGDPNSHPEAGDLIIYDWGDGSVGHIAVCTDPGDGNTYTVMEQDGTQNGGWGGPAYLIKRSYAGVIGWCRPTAWITANG